MGEDEVDDLLSPGSTPEPVPLFPSSFEQWKWINRWKRTSYPKVEWNAVDLSTTPILQPLMGATRSTTPQTAMVLPLAEGLGSHRWRYPLEWEPRRKHPKLLILTRFEFFNESARCLARLWQGVDLQSREPYYPPSSETPSPTAFISST